MTPPPGRPRANPFKPPPPLPPADPFRPTKGRQRLRIVGVTLVTVVVLWFLLLVRPGGHPRHWPATPCVAGQTTGCVGGGLAVKLLPPEPAASR